ncbi:MAG: histidine phosphatase family protein [Lachnospiraceae bacterium]|nr:histidine phosphatase family protein [Lachnospiraceae bacterium]
MILYIARHGQTDYNVQDRVCGVSEGMLTDYGREQARALGEKIRQVHIDKVYVSPLKRAIETAELALMGTGLDYEIEPRLIEHNFGECEGVPRLDPTFQFAKKNLGVKQPGGDSFLQLCHRAYGLIEDMRDKHPDESVLFVCHGTLGRAMRTYFVDMSNDDIYEYNMENCELLRFEVK